ncbi:hypothetical protein DPEC_G00214300 [Dallia pectoralis]|uniref:Uncharacterized protein n=1 Tax=Dallia pectoralis TaxID=75939 RepID=A0ACC2G1Z2_DALPE|nr:hypothetical protein DPEC_G00214300 [Dallia pectoralis]
MDQKLLKEASERRSKTWEDRRGSQEEDSSMFCRHPGGTAPATLKTRRGKADGRGRSKRPQTARSPNPGFGGCPEIHRFLPRFLTHSLHEDTVALGQVPPLAGLDGAWGNKDVKFGSYGSDTGVRRILTDSFHYFIRETIRPLRIMGESGDGRAGIINLTSVVNGDA